MPGRVESVNVSRGGVPKANVVEAFVTKQGVDGDSQRDLRVHGGPDRAVSVFSSEVIRALQRNGHPIAPGTIGENLTVSGIEWAAVAPGRELRVGGVRLLVTGYAAPCENIRHSFGDKQITRVSQKRHPGCSRVYTRVLEEGLVRVGDPVELV
jgi:MOSC domain-containing protein YiiM